MTGAELIKFMDNNKGKKISAPIYFSPDIEMRWVFVERADFRKQLLSVRNNETGCHFVDNDWYIELVRG